MHFVALCILILYFRVCVENGSIIRQPSCVVAAVYVLTLIFSLGCVPYDSMITNDNTLNDDKKVYTSIVNNFHSCRLHEGPIFLIVLYAPPHLFLV